MAFVARRLGFALLIIIPPLFDIFPVMQMGFIINCNLAICAFNIYTFSFTSKAMNFIEIFNEICNLIISIFLFSMGRISDGEQLYISGLWCNYFIIFMFVFNVGFIMVQAAQDCITKCNRRRKI